MITFRNSSIKRLGKLIFYFALLGCLSMTLVSCTDVIDPNIIGEPSFTKRPVIDALINDKSDNQVVILTWSQAYFDNNLPKPITGATVVVKEKNATTDRDLTFTEDPNRPGYYVYNGLRAQELTTYSLTINHDGEIYKAQTYCPRRLSWVQNPAFYDKPMDGRYDTLYFQFRKGTPAAPNDSGYQVQLRIADIRGLGDCYRLLSYRNGKLLNQPGNLNVYQDGPALDGINFIPPALIRLNPVTPNDSAFRAGQNVTIEIQCIDRDSYDYWLQVQDQITNGGLFAEPPANVPCNIKNQREGGLRPLGWFGSATTLTQSAVIQPRVNVEYPK